MQLVIFLKGARVPVGSVSPSGAYHKVTEGRWVRVSASRKNLPARVRRQVTVPPAWTDVHYFSDPGAKLLVKGKDAKGRMQYLYNPEHVTMRAAEKFARINALNKSYDAIVEENAGNARKGSEEAQCLLLVLATGIRPGSEKETKGSVQVHGATTLEGRHVVKQGDAVRLEFIGKRGLKQSIPVNDPGVAKMLLRRKRTMGKNGRLFGVIGDQLLRYAKGLGGGAGFQTKDFRTHLGTDVALKKMRRITRPKTMLEYKKAVRAVADAVAARLGNTRKVALQSYVNPAIFERWRSKLETT